MSLRETTKQDRIELRVNQRQEIQEAEIIKPISSPVPRSLDAFYIFLMQPFRFLQVIQIL